MPENEEPKPEEESRPQPEKKLSVAEQRRMQRQAEEAARQRRIARITKLREDGRIKTFRFIRGGLDAQMTRQTGRVAGAAEAGLFCKGFLLGKGAQGVRGSAECIDLRQDVRSLDLVLTYVDEAFGIVPADKPVPEEKIGFE